MENEKRKVGDYTVLCAVNIGAREFILAENEQSTNGERFLCCYGERNDIFEKFTECAVGDDYIDAALFFAERIKQDTERFREEVEKLDIPVTVITQADCRTASPTTTRTTSTAKSSPLTRQSSSRSTNELTGNSIM